MERNLLKKTSMAMMFAGIGTDYRKAIQKLPGEEREKIRQLSALLKDRYELDIDSYLDGNPLDTVNNFG